MALLDMFGRRIEPGDVLIYYIPKNLPLKVISVTQPSVLNPQQAPVVELKLSSSATESIPNPQGMPNVMIDMIIVEKAANIKPADA